MLKKLLVLTCIGSLSSFGLQAGWEKNDSYSSLNIMDLKENGIHLGTWMGVPDMAQPTNITCGATVLSMDLYWETAKHGTTVQYDIQSIYDAINKSGDGLTSYEFKIGKAAILEHTASTYNLPLDVVDAEYKTETIDLAISTIFENISKNHSVATIVGNTTVTGIAGKHYYLASGAVYCPVGTCSETLAGLFIIDSVYNSPAYEADSDYRKEAVAPRAMLFADELKDRWKKTGSTWPLPDKHVFMGNSK